MVEIDYESNDFVLLETKAKNLLQTLLTSDQYDPQVLKQIEDMVQ